MSDELEPGYSELLSEGETEERDTITRTRSAAAADGDLIVAPYPLRAPVLDPIPPGEAELPI